MPDPFRHQIRVGWGDCDPARIAYSARIPAWALESIDAWWEHHLNGDGWFQMELDHSIGTPFVHMSFDFRHPITPRHRLICEVWPNKLGHLSVGFRVNGYQGDALCFEGRFVSVFMDGGKFEKKAPPEEWRALIRSHMRDDEG